MRQPIEGGTCETDASITASAARELVRNRQGTFPEMGRYVRNFGVVGESPSSAASNAFNIRASGNRSSDRHVSLNASTCAGTSAMPASARNVASSAASDSGLRGSRNPRARLRSGWTSGNEAREVVPYHDDVLRSPDRPRIDVLAREPAVQRLVKRDCGRVSLDDTQRGARIP